MTILDHFLQDLAKTPSDWDFLGLVADWAEDNDQPYLAECLRWMIRQRKRPNLDVSGTGTWFNAETIPEGLGDPESDVPAVLYKLLEGGNEIAHHKMFPTVREAEKALLMAWVKAPKRDGLRRIDAKPR